MFLEKEGYEVFTACNGDEVLKVLSENNSIDLILLDILMPSLDGKETCRIIRECSNLPIIMLTALDDIENEVQSIEIGADDYISKPFSQKKLIARVKRLIKRTREKNMNIFESEGFSFHDFTNSVSVKGKEIELTPKEYELLQYLVLNKYLVLSRDQILNKVWGYDYSGDPRTIDTHIKSLRSKLGESGSKIKTLRNKGYSYSGEI